MASRDTYKPIQEEVGTFAALSQEDREFGTVRIRLTLVRRHTSRCEILVRQGRFSHLVVAVFESLLGKELAQVGQCAHSPMQHCLHQLDALNLIDGRCSVRLARSDELHVRHGWVD
jgi:hypothetical protein